jgi:tRNA nucleotidyltransferase (CCA-adding enzyme)
MQLPEDVRNIIETIEKNGCEAYAVGGCVRDSLLGKTPSDWDITTSALPMQVKAMFRRTVDTGIKHGTVTVMVGKCGYEVTTYRIDGEYRDARHPENVEFAVNLSEDLKRRDFTINAMAYNEKNGLVDEFDGQKDLKAGIVRCVGDPVERFTEDALRMMRAVRFSAQLSFSIDEATYKAIERLAANISKVSMERIQVELTKTLVSDNPQKVELYHRTGIFSYVLPEVAAIFDGRYRQTTLSMLSHTGNTAVLRYAALLNSLEPQQAASVLRELKLDNHTIDSVRAIIQNSKSNIEENEPAIREALNRYGRELLENLLVHDEALTIAKEESTGIMLLGRHNHLKAVRQMLNDIIARGDCVTVKDLDITGNDLIEYGLKGQEIGRVLNELLRVVMDNPKLNDKATLLAMLEHFT